MPKFIPMYIVSTSPDLKQAATNLRFQSVSPCNVMLYMWCDINLYFMHTIQGGIQILYRIEVQTLLIDCHRYDLDTEIGE